MKLAVASLTAHVKQVIRLPSRIPALRPVAIAAAVSVVGCAAIAAAGALLPHGKPAWSDPFWSPNPLSPGLAISRWGAPWDAVAAPPSGAIAPGLNGFAATLGWLGALGMALCALALYLHLSGWTLSLWKGLVVRSALGARWRHLSMAVARRWFGAGGMGVAGGTLVAALVGLALLRRWPVLMGQPVGPAWPMGTGAAVALCLSISMIFLAMPLAWFTSRRRQLATALQGDRATNGRALLMVQSVLAAISFASLLVVASATLATVRDASGDLATNATEVPNLHLTTVRAVGEAADDPAIRASAFQHLWARYSAREGDGVALSSAGAWLGLGPVVPVTAFCEACFVGVFFSPVNTADVRVVSLSPGAVALMAGRVVAGRDLDVSDVMGATPVALLNQAAAYRLFPGADSIGRTIHVGGPAQDGHVVAGVVRHALPPGPGNADAVPTIFISIFQHPPPVGQLASEHPPTLAAAPLAEPDEPLALTDGGDVSRERDIFEGPLPFFGAAMLAISAVAIAVACLGLIAVMVQTVQARRRELGVRLALGAPRRHLVGWVFRRALHITGAGILMGATGSRIIWDVLYPARTPEGALTNLAMLTVAFAALALLSSILPALRAVRLEPAALWSSAAVPRRS
jgi:FtsX-like permease family/MacB-like periplasmic core domain